MDLETAKFLFSILQFLLTGGIGIYVYMAQKNRVTNDRINSLEGDIDARLDDHGERISRIEGDIRNAPTHEDLAALHEKINRIGEDLRGIAGEFSGTRNLLAMIHDHLLNQRTKP